MLPFLKRNKDASASGPVESIVREPDEGKEFDSIEACAHDLNEAVKSGDIQGIASALRSAFEILQSESQEGPGE